MGPAELGGYTVVYDKPSSDGSAKLNIRPDSDGVVPGVVYQIADSERAALDAYEAKYTAFPVDIDGEETLTYRYEGHSHEGQPYDWYVAMAQLGAASHGIENGHLETATTPDPLAPGIRPAGREDLPFIQSLLSEGLVADTDRYYIHPGDYAWWVYHDDPRYPDAFATWIQGESGYVTIDSHGSHENEISVFTRPGVDRMPLVRWAQRRLGNRGEVGWISDDDHELVADLEADGYQPVYTNRSYRWDLRDEVPSPELAEGWSLRAVAGEDEANSRRAASHAAFESTMPSAMHLQRYLDFMRSPVYVPERDLIAVTPDGTVAAFMVWWGDESGVAQIEPFGTHPDHQGQGIGRALMYHGLHEMKTAGMHTCRVITDEPRPATAFYEGVGFTDVGRVRSWRKAS